MRVTFFKDDLENICYSACHLYHEINPKAGAKKNPKEIVLNKQQNRESQREQKQIGGKSNLVQPSWKLGLGQGTFWGQPPGHKVR